MDGNRMPLGSGTIRNVRRLQVLFSSLECPTSLGESVDSSMQSNTKKRVYLIEGREKFLISASECNQSITNEFFSEFIIFTLGFSETKVPKVHSFA